MLASDRVPQFRRLAAHAKGAIRRQLTPALIGEKINVRVAVAAMDVLDVRYAASEVGADTEQLLYRLAVFDKAFSIRMRSDGLAIAITPHF